MDGGTLIEGRIKIGSSMQTMLIRELKKRIPDPDEILIYDAPPGTSCPVVETISDADYIILVAEPTPFGLHDLMLMTELLNEIQRPFGVIVNKAGLGTNAVYSYLNDQGITLLGEIPFNEDYASCYATGNLFDSVPQDVTDSYYLIIERLEQKIPLHEGNNCLKW
jgi:MinD superfamily P-loop ATPase